MVTSYFEGRLETRKAIVAKPSIFGLSEKSLVYQFICMTLPTREISFRMVMISLTMTIQLNPFEWLGSPTNVKTTNK